MANRPYIAVRGLFIFFWFPPVALFSIQGFVPRFYAFTDASGWEALPPNPRFSRVLGLCPVVLSFSQNEAATPLRFH